MFILIQKSEICCFKKLKGGGVGINISSEDERIFCINYYYVQYVLGKYVNDEVKNEFMDCCFVFVY